MTLVKNELDPLPDVGTAEPKRERPTSFLSRDDDDERGGNGPPSSVSDHYSQSRPFVAKRPEDTLDDTKV